MKKNRKSKDFIHLPQFPGGKPAFQEFVRIHLKYPEEALKAHVEGKVYLKYEVTDNGDVINVDVIKGLGYGCDEEAVRVVQLMKYDKVKNRGVRLKSNVKTSIEFRINPAPAPMQYQYVPKPQTKQEEQPPKPAPVSYSYTLKIN